MKKEGTLENALKKYFPNAISGKEFTRKVVDALAGNDFTNENTLFVNSRCPDPANTETTTFKEFYGHGFLLGGLGGLPAADIGGLAASFKQIPDGGNLFIFYTSHIGITDDGRIGYTRRKSQSKDSACCSAVLTYHEKALKAGKIILGEGIRKVYVPQEPSSGRQQYDLEKALAQYHNFIFSIENEQERKFQLSHITSSLIYERICHLLEKTIKKKEINFAGQVAIVGGVTINTSNGHENLVEGKRFEIRDYNKGTTTDYSDVFQRI